MEWKFKWIDRLVELYDWVESVVGLRKSSLIFKLSAIENTFINTELFLSADMPFVF